MRMALLQLVLLLAYLWTSSFEIVELNHSDNDFVIRVRELSLLLCWVSR